MISFSLTSSGGGLFNGASVLIDAVRIYNGESQIGSDITTFCGNVVKDNNDNGGYIVLSWIDDSTNSYTITEISLLSGSTVVATSEPVSAIKANNKILNMRMSATFPGVTKCIFDTTVIGLPLATQYRQGVVRFADPNESLGGTDNGHLETTVYTAAETLRKIDSALGGADLDSYVPWDLNTAGNPTEGALTANKITIANSYGSPDPSSDGLLANDGGDLTLSAGGVLYLRSTFGTDMVLNAGSDEDPGCLSLNASSAEGTCVSDSPEFGTHTSGRTEIVHGNSNDGSRLVTDTYVANLYYDGIPNDSSEDSKLVTVGAVKNYVATNVFDDSNVVHLSNAETITGNKTFSGNIIANGSVTGSAIYSEFDGSTLNSALNKVPTVGVAIDMVDDAMSQLSDSLDETFVNMSNTDSELQSQIDALNAGQNLADIVEARNSLFRYDISNLKAKNDFIYGSEDTYNSGDKIQVLHDTLDHKAITSAIQNEESIADIAELDTGISTVYELVKLEDDITKSEFESQTQYAHDIWLDVPNDNGQYYWRYIGEYGSDSYTKSQSDSQYVAKDHIATSAHESANDYVPSVAYMQAAISSAVTGGATDFVKLYSEDEQEITSDLSINGFVGLLKEDEPCVLNISSYSNSTEESANIAFGCDGDSGDAVIYYSYNVNNSWLNQSIVFNPHIGDSDTSYGVIIDNGNNDISLQSTLRYDDYAPDVCGGLVASYRDFSDETLVDGRLTTVDYVNSLASQLATYHAAMESSRAIGELKSSDNNWTGDNKFDGAITGDAILSSSYTNDWQNPNNADKLPTVSAVSEAISDSLKEISSLDHIGCIGLFLYTEVGTEKAIGSTVSGQYLRPVGLSLPMSGQISYKSANPISPLTGTWTLLSLAVKRTATEPCLVLAQKTDTTNP